MSQFNIKKKRIVISAVVAIVFVWGLFPLFKYVTHSDESEVYVESVMTFNEVPVKIFHQAKPQKGLLIYLSDKTLGALNVQYAKELARLDYYVAVVDSDLLNFDSNIKNHCLNLSEQLNQFSDQFRVRYKLNLETLPILVGNGVGAALVYAALAQQEKKRFFAGVSINFLPTIKSAQVLCHLNNFQIADSNVVPTKNLHTSWYVFQDGTTAHSEAAESFFARVDSVRITVSEQVSKDLNAEALQILQWLDPRLTDQLTSSSGDSDLPIVEVEAGSSDRDLFTVMLTGDGGWAEIDKNLATHLAAKGIPTVALDSLSYFWRKRTPEETATAIDELISQYGQKWNKHKVILLGFSFGAEVLPFVANRLSNESKTKVALIALLSIGKTASFEFHLSNWINPNMNVDRTAVRPELRKLNWIRTVCIYGESDRENGCAEADGTAIKRIPMSGDHHFNGQYELLTEHVINSLMP